MEYVDDQTGRVVRDWVFSKCRLGQHAYCSGDFQGGIDRKGRDISCVCSCDCHADDYEAYREERSQL